MSFDLNDWQWESLNGVWYDLGELSPPYYTATEFKIRRKTVLKEGYYAVAGFSYVYYRAGTDLWTVRSDPSAEDSWKRSDLDDKWALDAGVTFLGTGDKS